MGQVVPHTRVIAEYTLSMQRRGLAAGTIYKRQLELRSWMGQVGTRWPTVDRRVIDEWLDTRPLGARARYSSISHLSAFYRWAMREGLADGDPTMMVERPKLPRRLPRPVPSGQVQRLLASAGLLHVVILLMLDAGLRCCEVARLRWCDVDLEAGTLFVHGKGGRDRLVGTPRRLRMALYLADADSASEWVAGRELQPCRVSQLVGELARTANLEGVTAHRLRHTYATRLYEATAGDLGAVQLALGHASITNTQIYAYVDPVRALDAARKLDAA